MKHKIRMAVVMLSISRSTVIVILQHFEDEGLPQVQNTSTDLYFEMLNISTAI